MLSGFAMPPGRLLSSQPAFHLTRIGSQLQSLLLCVMQPFHHIPSQLGRDVSEGALRETAGLSAQRQSKRRARIWLRTAGLSRFLEIAPTRPARLLSRETQLPRLEAAVRAASTHIRQLC